MPEVSTGKLVAINFSEKEYKMLERAESYGVLRKSQLLTLMIKSGLDRFNEACKENSYIFLFEKNEEFVKGSSYKMMLLRIPEKEYNDMSNICKHTPFSMASLAKYFVLPEIRKIDRERRCNYKL